jgi:hypothetical protein
MYLSRKLSPLALTLALILGLSLLALVLATPANAVQPLKISVAPEPVKSGSTNLHHLTKASGYIFAGTVQSVQHVSPSGANGIASTQITFHVDQAIRGVRNGQTLAIREWAGLWRSGERYRVGERVLLFLYPFSKLGFTSPVGGSMGRFVVDEGLRVLLEPASQTIVRSTPVPKSSPGKTQVSLDDFVRVLSRAEE